jgi:hypothetical protein
MISFGSLVGIYLLLGVLVTIFIWFKFKMWDFKRTPSEFIMGLISQIVFWPFVLGGYFFLFAFFGGMLDHIKKHGL